MKDITFANSEYFYLLLALPLIIFWYWKKNRTSTPELQFSGIEGLRAVKKTLKIRFRHSLFVFRILSLAGIITALARPQSTLNWHDVTTEGIDIVICLDISGSMLAEDFKPNRLEACKKIAMEFIDGRPDDRMGLVIFSGESFTQCPLTIDHSVLKNLFGSIKSGMIEDGTAIGSAIITSLNRLRQSKAKSKVIVLLTDGRNNAGNISPETAAHAAKALGVKIYTIGAGTKGLAPYPVQDFFGNKAYQPIKIDIDDEMLATIANITAGEYFRATDTESLKEIYKRIDRMEKTPIEETGFAEYKELFVNFLIIGFGFLILEIVLGNTILRRIP